MVQRWSMVNLCLKAGAFIALLVSVAVAWFIHSCGHSELCAANKPLFAILLVLRWVLPENPLHRDVNKLREFMSKSKPAVDMSKNSVIDDIVQPGNVSIRIYHRPSQQQQHDHSGNEARLELQPVIFWFHGGGWVVGDHFEDIQCAKMMEYTDGYVVVSVGYRLAPEHKFPAAIHDASAVLRWAKTNIHQYGGNSKQMILAGESAGGNIAASLAAMNYDPHYTDRHGKADLVGMVLLYPCLEHGVFRDSHFRYGMSNYPILTFSQMAHFWSMYLNDQWTDGHDYRAVPMRTPPQLMKQLPPTLLVLAKFDILLDEGLAYARLLEDVNVPVQTIVYNDTIHGFFAKPGLTTEPQTKEICTSIRQFGTVR